MASSVTHAYFIMDVYEKLDIQTKKLLIDEKPLLRVAAQGMDPFFFYRILSFRKGKRIREFGEFFHNHFCYSYFEVMINYIKYNGYGSNSEVMAFLYGALSHYILDSNMHPFIHYKTGVYDAKNPDTYRYNMLHGEVESMFDAYLISLREHILPGKFRTDLLCLESFRFSPTLQEVIDFTFDEVFQVHSMTKFYTRALSDMRQFFYLFRYDPFGFKRTFYKFVDFICPLSMRRKTPLSYDLKIDYSFFNLEHKVWYHPTSKKIKQRTSILDIYTKSLLECVQTIQQIQDFIYEDKGDLKKILKDVSYSTGRDWKENYELKYFEF